MPTLKERERQFMDALLSAFPTQGALRGLTHHALGENLSAIAEGTLRDQVLGILEWVFSRGREEDLFRGALAENPTNPELVKLAAALGEGEQVTSPEAPTRAETRNRKRHELRTFIRGNLASNPAISGEVIQTAVGRLAKVKPHYVVVSVLGTRGGQIEDIVEDVQARFERASRAKRLQGEESLANARVVFNHVKAIHVRILLERLEPEEREPLGKLCKEIHDLMQIAARQREPMAPRLAFHLSIRSYRRGDWSAVRGVTISHTGNPLRGRQNSTKGHYVMGTHSLIAATMGPRELKGPTDDSSYCYEVFVPEDSERATVWSSYMARLFERFWERSKVKLFHRVVRAERRDGGEEEQG